MKIRCLCGSSIHDNTDYQSNKAYLIPDEVVEKVHEAIANGTSSWDAFKIHEKVIYQCSDCKRIFFPKQDGSDTLATFFPDEDSTFGALKALWDVTNNVNTAGEPLASLTFYAPPALGRWYQNKSGNFYEMRGNTLKSTYASPVTCGPLQCGETSDKAWAWR